MSERPRFDGGRAPCREACPVNPIEVMRPLVDAYTESSNALEAAAKQQDMDPEERQSAQNELTQRFFGLSRQVGTFMQCRDVCPGAELSGMTEEDLDEVDGLYLADFVCGNPALTEVRDVEVAVQSWSR